MHSWEPSLTLVISLASPCILPDQRGSSYAFWTPPFTLPDCMLHLTHSVTPLCTLLNHIVSFTYLCVTSPMRVWHRLERLHRYAWECCTYWGECTGVQCRSGTPHKSCCMGQEGSGHVTWVGKGEQDIWEMLQELVSMHKGTWGCRCPTQVRVVHGGTAWVEKQKYKSCHIGWGKYTGVGCSL